MQLRAERVRQACAILCIAIGGVVLFGWLFGVSALKTVLPGLTTMKANTALGVLAAGLALSSVNWRRPHTCLAAASVAVLLGGGSLLEYAFGISIGLDELLFADPGTTSPPFPGRMAPATAAGLVLSGAAAALLQRATGRPRPQRETLAVPAHLFAAVPASVGYLSIAGYAYDVKGLYSFGPFVSVALNTAVAFVLLATAIVLTLPEAGWGRRLLGFPTARRVLIELLPVALLAPFLTGGIVIWGARMQIYDPLYAPLLLALTATGSAAWLAWHCASAVRLAEEGLLAASQELRASEARLQLFVDRAPASIAMFDPAMRYQVVSRRYLQDYGLDAEAAANLIGRSHYDVFPDIPERWREIHRRVLAGETITAADDAFPRGDGRVDWIRWEMAPLLAADGSVTGALLFSEVMTERKEAERILAESEARLRVSQEAAHVGTWDWTIATNVIHWSAEQYRLYGLDADSLQPITYQAWKLALHPEDRSRVQAEVMAAVAGKAVYETQFRILLSAPDPSGATVRWLYARGEVIRDADGTPVRMLGVNLDITARIESEAAIRASEARLRETLARSRDELELLVSERTRDLREAQERLAHVQRMEALGQLAGGIAHDFNNVLQSVQSGASLLERRAADTDGVRRLARMVFDAAVRGNEITKRLLAFSRRGDLKAEPVDATALLGDMSDLLSHTLGAGIRVRTETAAPVSCLLADKAQLETVLVNLATNARDAMPSGGSLTLSAAAESYGGQGGPDHPPALKPGAYVRLAIADTGVGMDAPTLARASEPFFTTKPAGAGTGLGLAMARGFAEQSGGGLHIQSAPGEGTTVKLWFPATAPRSGPGSPAPIRAGAGPAGRIEARILLVDDESYVRDLLAEELESCGYSVVKASSGAAAIELLEVGEPVELLISDLSMPGLDGLTLVREAQRRRPKLPAILLTGFVTNAAELAVGGALEGSFSLLRKPVDGQHLAERAAMLLMARSDQV